MTDEVQVSLIVVSIHTGSEAVNPGGTMSKYTLLMAIFLLACKPEYRVETCREIDPSLKEKAAAFILKCIENANPKSDEEPEDWIHKCRDFAEDVYGFQGTKITTHVTGGYYRDSTHCKQLESSQ
jgi:hypothetical protein